MKKSPAPAVHPKSRAELIGYLARRWQVRQGVAAQRVDVMLELVLGVARRHRLDYAWDGNEVFDQLLRWKGERP